VTSEIRQQKDLNISGKIEWPLGQYNYWHYYTVRSFKHHLCQHKAVTANHTSKSFIKLGEMTVLYGFYTVVKFCELLSRRISLIKVRTANTDSRFI